MLIFEMIFVAHAQLFFKKNFSIRECSCDYLWNDHHQDIEKCLKIKSFLKIKNQVDLFVI